MEVEVTSAGVKYVESGCQVYLAQVSCIFGAGVRYCWRRCGKRGGTCATVARESQFYGAGPSAKTSPAPIIGPTCAKHLPHLRQTGASPAPILCYTCSKHGLRLLQSSAPPTTSIYSPSLFPRLVFSVVGQTFAERGFPTIRATSSGSMPKQRASCAMEVW